MNEGFQQIPRKIALSAQWSILFLDHPQSDEFLNNLAIINWYKYSCQCLNARLAVTVSLKSQHLISVALLTISVQSGKIAVGNPVKSLELIDLANLTKKIFILKRECAHHNVFIMGRTMIASCQGLPFTSSGFILTFFLLVPESHP